MKANAKGSSLDVPGGLQFIQPWKLTYKLLLPIIVAGFLSYNFLVAMSPVLAGVLLILMVSMSVAVSCEKIKAGMEFDRIGKFKGFTLTLGEETVMLEPGKSWTQVDRFKWCARGMLDAPQHFLVQPDGTVEVNLETIRPSDDHALEKLEQEISKRYILTSAFKTPATATSSSKTAGATGKNLRFRVRLDRMGHIVIEHGSGPERDETGLRGIPSLVSSGLLRQPQHLHVDPMQRAVEIDGERIECTESGAKRLQEILNARYATDAGDQKRIAIEIKENRVANTGFDIRFMTFHGGVSFEVKGHLSQETLDVLADPTRCDLLQPGIQLRLSPPFLLIRKRRDDMGEDKIPGIPDVNYLSIGAAQLQEILNHALIRRGQVEQVEAPQIVIEHKPLNIRALRLSRNSMNPSVLWMESVMTDGSLGEGKACTHHNVAELQRGGFFKPELDVCVSLDNSRLSVLDKRSKREETVAIGPDCSQDNIEQAGRLLTAALRPAVRVLNKSGGAIQSARKPSAPAAPSRQEPAPSPPRHQSPAPAAAIDPASTELFKESDATTVNQAVFQRLSEWLGIPVKEAYLSLPRIFENRRFEILNFEQEEITDFMDLRGEYFYGFYLSHVNDRKVLLVYACNGEHIEWGPDKCLLQHSMKSEREEFGGSALLGMAQDGQNEFVFIVKDLFKEWIKPREHLYTEENVHFITVAEYARSPEKFKLIWPVETSK